MPFRMHFAGESEIWSPDSVLSHCKGALLPMFSTKEATWLRLVCREFKEAVAEFPWEDDDRVILGSVVGWMACFPMARAANVSVYSQYCNKRGRMTQVTNADFIHLVGVNMSFCTGITDAGFKSLTGIKSLDVSHCSQPTITGAIFQHLQGVSLASSYCMYVDEEVVLMGCNLAMIAGAKSAGLISKAQADISRMQASGAPLPPHHLAAMNEDY